MLVLKPFIYWAAFAACATVCAQEITPETSHTPQTVENKQQEEQSSDKEAMGEEEEEGIKLSTSSNAIQQQRVRLMTA